MALKTNNIILHSILVVDDDQDSLDMYTDLLRKKTKAEIVTAKYPTQAANIAKEHLFDFVVIDVTIDYKGSPFGGLDLYKELLYRYGNSSLIAYSQYITDDLLKRYNYNFNFIEKKLNAFKFIDLLFKKIVTFRKRQSCFIAMPFDKKYDPLFRIIKKCVGKCYYKCLRVDEQEFTKSIIERVLQGIRDSKVIIFAANDKNPNAFYECGFAVALEKEVVTLTDYYSNLPFDIRDRNAIAYKGDLNRLNKDLYKRVSSLTMYE